jgi:hypothetical protein
MFRLLITSSIQLPSQTTCQLVRSLFLLFLEDLMELLLESGRNTPRFVGENGSYSYVFDIILASYRYVAAIFYCAFFLKIHLPMSRC